MINRILVCVAILFSFSYLAFGQNQSQMGMSNRGGVYDQEREREAADRAYRERLATCTGNAEASDNALHVWCSVARGLSR